MAQYRPEQQIELCHKTALNDGETLGFDTQSTGTDDIFIVKIGGNIYGWRNACPHIANAPMAWKRHKYMDATQTYISCHAHGALFEPNSGLCIQGPCLGQRLEPIDLYEREDGCLIFVDHRHAHGDM